MTHPPAGPATPTSPAGPGRDIPLTVEQRVDNYRRQNGTDRLTPRQRRRLMHKLYRSFTRAN